MTKLWYIYKQDGSRLGPLSAKEIREALRAGEIDPFDKVQKLNSKIRIELVEVDEIFKDEEDNKHILNNFSETVSEDTYKTNLNYNLKKAKDSVYNFVDEKDQSLINTYLSAKSTFANQMQQNKIKENYLQHQSDAVENKINKKKNPKRFNLIDSKNRIIGPLSPQEIASLFFKGVIPNSTLVQKIGQQKTIPIAKFIALYAAQKNNNQQYISAVTKLSIENNKNVSSSILLKLSSMLALRNQINNQLNKIILFFSILFLIFFIGFFAYVVITNKNPQFLDNILSKISYSLFNNKKAHISKSSPQSTSLTNTNSVTQDSSAKISHIPSSNQNLNNSYNPQNLPQMGNNEADIKLDTKSTQENAITLAKDNDDNTKNYTHKQNDKGHNKVKKYKSNISKKKSQKQQKFYYNTTNPPVSYYSNINNKSPTPTSYSSTSIITPKSSQSNLHSQYTATTQYNYLDSQIGKVITLNKMSFNKSELQNCELKCKLKFKDTNGITVNGVFFKQAFLNALQNASYVNITGTLKKSNNEYIIYIQKIYR